MAGQRLLLLIVERKQTYFLRLAGQKSEKSMKRRGPEDEYISISVEISSISSKSTKFIDRNT
jgi:hypothetical protein